MTIPSTRALRAAGATALLLAAISGTVAATDPATVPAPAAAKTIVQTRVVTTAKTIHLPLQAQQPDGESEADGRD